MTSPQAAPVLSATQLADAFASNSRLIARQVEGLTHADSLLQPPVRGNCLNWIVGHIAIHRDYILEALGEPKLLGERARARYDRGSAPILGEGEGVLPLETLLAAIDRAQARIAAALARSTEESLAQAAPSNSQATVARQLTFFYWHETYHTGQTELLRQLAGANDQVI